jgi:hypothetical protein
VPAAEPLQFSVHAMPAPGLADGDRLPAPDPRQRRVGRWKMLAVLAVCAAPVVASYFTYFVIRPQGRTNYADLVLPTRAVPSDLPLATLDGRPVPASSLKGQWLLVTVGPGACDAACEKRLYLQRQLREMTGRESERIDKVWLITDDAPVSPVLQEALKHPVPTQALRVPRERLAQWLQPADGHTLEQHVYVVDPMGEWMMRAPVDPQPSKLKRDLDRLLRASSSWDQPGR